MDDLKQKTDEELDAIEKDSAPNSYVSVSIYHDVQREKDRRHRLKIEQALAEPKTIGIVSNGADAKIIGNSFSVNPGVDQTKEPWYKKWWGQIFIAVAALIIGTLLLKVAGF
jgi:hypothetical protein